MTAATRRYAPPPVRRYAPPPVLPITITDTPLSCVLKTESQNQALFLRLLHRSSAPFLGCAHTPCLCSDDSTIQQGPSVPKASPVCSTGSITQPACALGQTHHTATPTLHVLRSSSSWQCHFPSNPRQVRSQGIPEALLDAHFQEGATSTEPAHSTTCGPT
ncbi:hypothetical protein NDU88_010788 [Pleurodeles waltl]|uniref:Uncharacterized protein n=1 Tax=Pleurodeles waltl TaxID=8319 RepID=A0AAV7QZ75_PLEWA|nr:hypothetical protein NDU88_010788 [Pleurodeles waltl]